MSPTNAALSCQKAEDFVSIRLNPDYSTNWFPTLCDHHWPTAFGDLIYHREALRFEFSGWNLLHKTLRYQYDHKIMTTLEKASL